METFRAQIEGFKSLLQQQDLCAVKTNNENKYKRIKEKKEGGGGGTET